MWHDTTVSDEILIIGGGVVGLALGWRLRQEGARVSIVERGICGRSAGWASAGLVQAAPDVAAAARRKEWSLGPSATLTGLVYATGHFKTGIVLAPETARMLAPLLLRGERDPRLGPFGVERLRPSSALP